MWQDVIKIRDARQTVERLDDYDFNDVIGSEFDYVMVGIRKKYYPHFDEDRKEKFDMLIHKTGRFLNQFDYRKTLRGVKGVKKMVNQFDLPDLDYLIELLELKEAQPETNS
tara:strand:+ start:851 stop:1183 length:333 start_codon:yes stop_codon:yes gene_type:complete